MKFKDFLQEDGNSQETGVFINAPGKETLGRVPSDGQPFSQYLNHTSGAKQSQNSGGGGGGGDMGMGGGGPGAMFMKQFMRRMMSKKMSKKMKK